MKRLIAGIFIALTTLTVTAAQLDLRDITDNVFKGETMSQITPLKDGIHYVASNSDNTRIEKYDYRTGKVVATLFDVNTARECNLKSFDGYALSDDETRLLIYAESEPIYRRSFKANYYTFEIKRNLLKPLSEGGKQQAAVYSPNGRMVAFVRDNNIYLKNSITAPRLPSRPMEKRIKSSTAFPTGYMRKSLASRRPCNGVATASYSRLSASMRQT